MADKSKHEFTLEDVQDIRVIIKANDKNYSIVAKDFVGKDVARNIRISMFNVLSEYHDIVTPSLEEIKDTETIKWIPTSERLPEKHKYVLLKTKDNEWKVEFIHEFDLTTQRFTRNYTHWALISQPIQN